MMRLFREFTPRFLCSMEGDGGAAGASASSAPSSSAAPATSAPSADSSSSPSPSPSSPSSEQGSDYMNLGLPDDDLEDLPVDLPKSDATVTPSPASPQAAQQVAPQEQQPPQPVQQQPAQQVPPQGGPQAQTAQPSSSSPAEPQDLVQAIEQNREALVQALAQDAFGLSKEEVEAIETDVIGNLPRVQAKVYLKAVQTTHKLINTLVPQLVQQVLNANKAKDETEAAFYGRFKGLDKAKHHGDVLQFATTLRQVNPQITQDELWSMVAASVAAKHGLASVMGAAAPSANGGTAPRLPQQEPFVPARPGATVRVTPEPDNPFMGMGRDFDNDDG